jgi:transposase
VCDGQGRPIILLLTEGQMSDHKGACLLLSSLPRAKELLGDKGYDSNWFRQALIERGITPCIPPRSNRKVQIDYDKALYRQRHKSKTSSAASRTGGASPRGTTDAPTPSCQPSPSPQPSATGCNQ